MTKEEFIKVCKCIPKTKFVRKKDFLKLVKEGNNLSLISPRYKLILLKERLQAEATLIDTMLRLYNEYINDESN